MKELMRFEGELFKDLTPVVGKLVAEARAKGENPGGALLLLDDSGVSILIKSGSLETMFPLPRRIEARALGVAEEHFAQADGSKSDGLTWRYAES